jgi:hypothetical protein
MPRVFNDADRRKKEKRITKKVAGESTTDTAALEKAVTDALSGSYLSCPSALSIAKNLKIPARQVGDTTDNLGLRVVNCQLGCFKVEKAASKKLGVIDPVIVSELEAVLAQGNLTCAKAFAIARKLKKNVGDIGDVANAKNFKIRECQLGCF